MCKQPKYYKSDVWRRHIVLMQPLPSVAFECGAEVYSEFASLGLAILGGWLRLNGMEQVEILYPKSAAEAVDGIRDADVVILGDFRYYSYFCNPKPLLVRIIDALKTENFDGLIVLAGRHSAYMKELGSSRVYVCSSISDSANVLGVPELASVLGNGSLPMPAEAPADLLVAKDLNGSASRPITGIIGQVLIRSGCLYRCGFCEKAGQKTKYIGNTMLRKHLVGLREIGTKYLVVWDDTFGELGRSYDEVLRLLRDVEIPFGCNTRADLLTDRFAEKLAESGCREVLVGIEVSPWEEEARNALGMSRRKALKADRLLATVDRLANRGIKPVGSVIIGLPEDNAERIEERINACFRLGFQHLYVRPLVPFPESLLYREQVANGMLTRFEYWTTEAWNTYPHGYPTVCATVRREQLCGYATRAN